MQNSPLSFELLSRLFFFPQFLNFIPTNLIKSNNVKREKNVFPRFSLLGEKVLVNSRRHRLRRVIFLFVRYFVALRRKRYKVGKIDTTSKSLETFFVLLSREKRKFV